MSYPLRTKCALTTELAVGRSSEIASWSPMERYDAWDVISGHRPTSTTWHIETASLEQRTSQSEWSLVGWAPLFQFEDGAVDARLDYIEEEDLDAQGAVATAPIGLRVNSNGDGIFWKTNNGELQLIDRSFGVRTVLYSQPAPPIGTFIRLEVSGSMVNLDVDGVEVFSGITSKLDAGYGAMFIGEISKVNVTLVSDIHVSAGGYYAPMETHPDYDILPGGSDRSLYEYNDITGELWLGGATDKFTALVNTSVGIVSQAEFSGIAQPAGALHSVQAAFHIQSGINYAGIRLHSNNVELVEVVNDTFFVLSRIPYSLPIAVSLSIDGSDVTMNVNGIDYHATLSTFSSGYIGAINRRHGASRSLVWLDWRWIV